MNMSQASSCDYSMSQFRPDESSFDIKAEEINDEDSQFGSYVTNNVQDDDPLSLRKEMSQHDHRMVVDQIEGNDDDEEDIPIAARKKVKREISEDDEDDIPLTARQKIKTEKKAKKKKHELSDNDEDDYDEKPKKKKVKKEKVNILISSIGTVNNVNNHKFSFPFAEGSENIDCQNRRIFTAERSQEKRRRATRSLEMVGRGKT